MKTGPPSFSYVAAAALLGSAVIHAQTTGATELPADQCQHSDHWNALASDGLEYVAADTFSPQADGAVSQVNWSGGYLSGADDCDPGNADAFEITYFDGAGGYPGSIIAGPFAQDKGTLTVTGPTATDEFLLEDVPEYAYEATHAPLPVLAGQCYWIEIRNPRADGCAWYWAVAQPTDRIAIHERGAGEIAGVYDAFDLIARDFAFCLDVAIGAPAFCGVTPANDTCEDRMTISEGAHPFATIAATSTGNDRYDYNYYVCCCDGLMGDQAVHRDIWFEYVPSCDGMLRLDVCDAAFDSKIFVYQDYTCPGYGHTPHACNDDGCGHEPSGFDGECYQYPDRAIVPCWDDTCLGRVRAVDPNCWYTLYLTWPWPPHCDALAEAVCRKPDTVQSDLVARVEAGLPYLIRVGGYPSDDGHPPAQNPACLGRICRIEPACCEEVWDSYCDELVRELCRGDAGTGTLNVELVALPPVLTSLRHFHDFLGCFTGPCATSPCEPPIYPEPCCLNQDFDNDGDVDTDDYAHHLAPSLTGP